jgi:hypothetical protein
MSLNWLTNRAVENLLDREIPLRLFKKQYRDYASPVALKGSEA